MGINSLNPQFPLPNFITIHTKQSAHPDCNFVMATLTLRSFQNDLDFTAITHLIRLSKAGQLDEDTSTCELQLQLNSPFVDKTRDLGLWEDEEGTLIGFGRLLIPEFADTVEGYLWFCIHPKAYGDNLENQILQWAEKRLQAVAKERQLPAILRVNTSDDTLSRILLLERQGFQEDRRFLTMGYPLNQPLENPQFPEGFSIKHFQGNEEIESWVEMYNQSFVDHWNHHDLGASVVQNWLNHPHYQPQLNLIAIAPNQAFAAFCYCQINPNEREGWIKLLGTRRGFRKLGLGRAMLLSGMQRLKTAGAEIVKLGVDATSPTGATRLYESVGFQTLKTWIYYAKPLASRML